MYAVDFDVQVTNYAEELCFPPERVSRVELSRIIVRENTYAVFINKSLYDRLHFIVDVTHDERPYYDIRNPPPLSLRNISESSLTISLRPRREGKLVGFMFVYVEYEPDQPWEIVIGAHNFPGMGFVSDSNRKQLIPLTSPLIHTISSFREVTQSTPDMSTDLVRRFL